MAVADIKVLGGCRNATTLRWKHNKNNKQTVIPLIKKPRIENNTDYYEKTYLSDSVSASALHGLRANQPSIHLTKAFQQGQFQNRRELFAYDAETPFWRLSRLPCRRRLWNYQLVCGGSLWQLWRR